MAKLKYKNDALAELIISKSEAGLASEINLAISGGIISSLAELNSAEIRKLNVYFCCHNKEEELTLRVDCQNFDFTAVANDNIFAIYCLEYIEANVSLGYGEQWFLSRNGKWLNDKEYFPITKDNFIQSSFQEIPAGNDKLYGFPSKDVEQPTFSVNQQPSLTTSSPSSFSSSGNSKNNKKRIWPTIGIILVLVSIGLSIYAYNNYAKTLSVNKDIRNTVNTTKDSLSNDILAPSSKEKPKTQGTTNNPPELVSPPKIKMSDQDDSSTSSPSSTDQSTPGSKSQIITLPQAKILDNGQNANPSPNPSAPHKQEQPGSSPTIVTPPKQKNMSGFNF